MLIEDFVVAYNSHTHQGPTLPARMRDVTTRFPVGCFVQDKDGNVGIVTSHDLHNPPPRGGPVNYGALLFVTRTGIVKTTDFLRIDLDALRRVDSIEMLALAAGPHGRSIETLVALSEIKNKK